MNISQYAKYITIKVVRICLHLFYLKPLNCNKILFMSFGGKQISCNPLYIYRELHSQYPTLNCIWVITAHNKSQQADIQTVLSGSIMYIYHMLTASCLVTNDTLPSYLPFRKSQLVINTWHGGGLFKCIWGKATKSENEYNAKVNLLHNKDTSLYTSSAKVWTEKIAQRSFGYHGEMLPCGMARNDLFFADTSIITHKVKDFYHIPQQDAIVLYAPTFRGKSSGATMGTLEVCPVDVLRVVDALKVKYHRRFHFIFRGHHTISQSMNNCLNASAYPDMQELLASADVFISDFSSCLWDFSLTYRPCFIYAPDFDEYAMKPGFESDYRRWPFVITKNNDELVNNISLFNLAAYQERVKCYHQEYGSYEQGLAAQKIVKFITNKIGL